MTTNKRTKFTRRRGSTSHGWGSMKKRRGKGNKGGAGMAGTGKKGDAKKPSIWKNKEYFGKHGFKKKNPAKINPVNLSYFEEKLDRLLAKKLIQQENDTIVIDAKKLGFNKVLGSGKITKKYKITADSFSKDAVEKIKAAGGEAIELKSKVKEPKTEEPKAGTQTTKKSDSSQEETEK
ncbi:50S ribosomal protein L15 [Candidatus Woesearchaeota archaeon]|nr:50S ribosomal protein L15 [Candidatus Woesearchaeota archaeon]